MIKSTFSLPAADNNYQIEHVSLMLGNLKKWTGYDLIKEYGFSLDTLGAQVFNADFHILSHDSTENPILTYGNDRVLKLWEVSWEELTNMHSRDTAKPVDQAERAAMMAQVKAKNYIDGYGGIRISKTGKEFKISDGIVWNLFTSNGDFYGQAAWFKSVDT
jgi:MEKHLA domain